MTYGGYGEGERWYWGFDGRAANRGFYTNGGSGFITKCAGEGGVRRLIKRGSEINGEGVT